MKLASKQLIACCLIALCVCVTGVLVNQSVAHAWQHAHHHANTHATPICAWMCAAGQVVQALAFGLDTEFLPLYQADIRLSVPLLNFTSLSPLSRAPPHNT